MLCFVSADSKGVTGVFCVSADSKGDSTGEVDSRPFGSAPFEAQGKQGRQFKVER